MSPIFHGLISKLREFLRSDKSIERADTPPPEETEYLPVPDRGNWWLNRLRQYLSEQGYEGLPVNPKEMEGYRKWLESKGYRPNSVACALAPVRKVYSDHMIYSLTVLGYVGHHQGRSVDPISEEETKRLIEYADQCRPKDRAIIYLKAYLGLRDVEIARLNIGDLFEKDGEHWLRMSAAREGREDTFLRVEKGLLKTMLAYHGEIKGRNVGHPMFFGQRGRMHPATISQTVTAIMRAAGVKREDNDDRIKPHSLRNAVMEKRELLGSWRNGGGPR
jgi:integrase